MTDTTTYRTLEVPGATIAYDVRGPLPAVDGRPPLVLIGQPMDATGFGTLASHFTDRTVVTYDPRGIGRSTRDDGRTDHDPAVQAQDLHALVTGLDAGPVDLFGSSGGAVTALAWVTAYPQDVRTLVAHEPPLINVLPDADEARAASARVDAAYQAHGWGTGMAAFIALTSWQGPFPADFLTELPDPARFGLPPQDDGTRNDPLLSGASAPVTAYVPDVEALRAVPTSVVLAAGIESEGVITWRTTHALADLLGTQVAVFPSNHGGFLGDEYGMPGQPEAFAARLREVLAEG
ncbi:alpha/beta fold hydrolase [Cellulomonas dongxiuzhuiae]|uniref:Alpha/beta hydrolase n=1 Tax=Cellulomonas dongxiuzhuiae TaxID=2819979 RepID=A0ABX8GKE7_9CELL|nr:alpha/beta hydrolase [Cellulomonas dongxiuzhuiae]MBO3095384.1 alpha/beta hydrolase [Cellulomonas dongxiuzhuiae]QWC16370.1 alpha/beta hydrolase [Cellulomonas dongxiuzhuiae]